MRLLTAKEIQKWKDLAEEKAKVKIFDTVIDVLNSKIDDLNERFTNHIINHIKDIK